MNVIRTFGPIQTKKPAVVMAIGFFDGVHRGHQSVIQTCREQAESMDADAWVMTFEPHPLQLLNPANAPRLITDLATKLDILQSMHVDGVMVVPFTQEFARLTPDDFLAALLEHIPQLRGIVVGRNWRFGNQAAGNTDMLRARAKDLPFCVTIAEPRDVDGQLISSSRIREAIASGRLKDVTAMLGRHHRVHGRVIDGVKRGRTLGFPTANLDLVGHALPPPGIYAARVYRDHDRSFGGAVYLPANPEQKRGLLEVHLIDYDGNLYGHELSVEFIEKIRDDDRRFANEQDLVAQISRDVESIRTLLATHERASR